MEQYETNDIVNNSIYGPYIRVYFRHVDVTFILYGGSNRKAKNMINYLNNINKNIKK